MFLSYINKIDIYSDIDRTCGLLSAVTHSDDGGDGGGGVDLPRDLQPSTKYPRLGIIIDFITRPGCASVARAIGLTERAKAILLVYSSYFIPGRHWFQGGRIICVCARVHSRAWRTHAGRQCVCEIEHAVVSVPLSLRLFHCTTFLIAAVAKRDAVSW